MSNPNKKWSWAIVLGRSAGPAIGGAGAAVTGALIANSDIVPLAIVAGAVSGFGGSFLGSVFGHAADDPPAIPDSFSSSLLFTTVLSSFIATLFVLLSLNHLAKPENLVAIVSCVSALSGFLSAATASVIDDMRARYKWPSAPPTEQNQPKEHTSLHRQLLYLVASGVEDPDVALWLGVVQNDEDKVRRAIERGANVNVARGTVLQRHAEQLEKMQW
ncbi:MAG TPA: hypothetical protein VHG32_16550 [Thermoanaerobaculia bacterium]|jgi:hypothetical protein|nr:hypothetical protein [Thermoanaerobaculia bacterium]